MVYCAVHCTFLGCLAPRLQLLCHPGKLASLGRDPLAVELQAVLKHSFSPMPFSVLRRLARPGTTDC